jgi:hypothetical protein
MTTQKIEQLGNEFFITTYFSDEYTPSRTWRKTYKTIKGAEKALNIHLELRNA